VRVEVCAILALDPPRGAKYTTTDPQDLPPIDYLVITMSNVQERAIVSRRQACGAFAGLASGLLAGGAEAQPVARADMLDKKRANARGRFESQSARSKKADPKIQELIGRIDRARLSDMVNTLTSFPTRWTMSPQLVAAGNWIKQQFSDFGYKASRIEQVELRLSNGTIAQNIVCAPERDHGFVLIGAHYDCISESAATLAPGADDNASGTAAVLEEASWIKDNPDLKFEVDGHTDNVGGEEYNQNLSEHRATSVRDYLVQEGVATNSVTAKGFGKTQPITSNETSAGRQTNRRVELVVSGDAIGAQVSATPGGER
jgi:hypothetical protein